VVLLRDPALDHVLGGRPRQTGSAVATAVLALTLVLGTVVLVVNGGPRDRSSAPPVSEAPAPVEANTGDAAEARPERLELPQPTGYESGVPVGYPHSSDGAIAAAYGYSRIASGVDVDETLAAIEVMAYPSSTWFARDRDDLADGLVAQRTALGLSAVGPATGASFSITPAGFQLLDDEPRQVRVLTLNIVSAVAVNGKRTSGTVVLDWTLRWLGDRWRVVAPYDNRDHDALAVAPMTSAAHAAGRREASGG